MKNTAASNPIKFTQHKMRPDFLSALRKRYPTTPRIPDADLPQTTPKFNHKNTRNFFVKINWLSICCCCKCKKDNSNSKDNDNFPKQESSESLILIGNRATTAAVIVENTINSMSERIMENITWANAGLLQVALLYTFYFRYFLLFFFFFIFFFFLDFVLTFF